MHSRRNMTNSNQQFAKDCSAEYLKVPPTLSPKCTDESKKLGEAGKRLQAGTRKAITPGGSTMKAVISLCARRERSAGIPCSIWFWHRIRSNPVGSRRPANSPGRTSSIPLLLKQHGTSSAPTISRSKMADLPQALYTSYSNVGRQQWTILTQPANTYGNSMPWMNAASAGLRRCSCQPDGQHPAYRPDFRLRFFEP